MSRETESPIRGRRALGAHYSPRPVVDDLVEAALGPLCASGRFGPEDPPRVCDPACGDGVFLASAAARLASFIAAERPEAPGAWVARRAAGAVFGVDLDPEAVRGARRALRLALSPWDRALPAAAVAAQVQRGNSLLAPGDAPRGWHPLGFAEAFPGARPGGRFDAVVGNPPFVDGAELARSAPALRHYLAARYQAASGNWDLFCVFVERCLGLATAGGYVALILPNKLLDAAYARETRRLLAAEELVRLRDYAGMRLFGASVYPITLVARRRKGRARRRPCRIERASGAVEAPRIAELPPTSPESLEERAAAGWGGLFGPARSPLASGSAGLRPLGSLCEVVGAATVAEAYALAPLLEDGAPPPGALRVVNTGLVDPYRVRWGERPLRYLGRSLARPWVDPARLREAMPRRAEQARGPKIVVAGLTRRLECVLDPGGLLAAKSTSLLRVSVARAAECERALALLALLNSEAASLSYRRQFSGLALSDGYLRVGPPQLRAFAVPDPGALPPRQRRELAALAEACACPGEPSEACARPGEPSGGEGGAGSRPGVPAFDEAAAAIDTLAWACFSLDPPGETGHAFTPDAGPAAEEPTER